jgi:hypothetical protein
MPRGLAVYIWHQPELLQLFWQEARRASSRARESAAAGSPPDGDDRETQQFYQCEGVLAACPSSLLPSAGHLRLICGGSRRYGFRPAPGEATHGNTP